MDCVHPLLRIAIETRAVCRDALKDLLAQIKDDRPQFLGTVAINLWSPYLPYGRHTELEYPPDMKGRSLVQEFGGRDNLAAIHRRYMTLLGRNVSANHLLLEVNEDQDVREIVVNAAAETLSGPTIRTMRGGRRCIDLQIPLILPDHDPDSLACIDTLVPKARLDEWKKWLRDPAYGRRFETRLREELGQCRARAREQLPEAFTKHLHCWIKARSLPSHVGLGDFDDRWLCRIQLTAIGTTFWGHLWRSRHLAFSKTLQSRLGLRATFTVTGVAAPIEQDSVKELAQNLQVSLDRWASQINSLLSGRLVAQEQELTSLTDRPWDGDLKAFADDFSSSLGGRLAGSDHEGKAISLRGLVTQGLDAIAVGPALVSVLHEIGPEELGSIGTTEESWGLWRAYFKSNDLLLSHAGMALHFELEVSADRRYLVAVPRHVVHLAVSVEDFLRKVGTPPEGLLTLGFETTKTMTEHVRCEGRYQDDLLRQVQTRAEREFHWPAGEAVNGGRKDWSIVADALYDGLAQLGTKTTIEFLSAAAASVAAFKSGQLRRLAEGIAEVSRRACGCLVFIGPVAKKKADDSRWFVDSGRSAIEITRLGVCFGIVSQVPEEPSPEFIARFADLAALDGETIVGTGPMGKCPRGFQVDPEVGGILGRQFVQLPQGTAPLLDAKTPKLSEPYSKAWDTCADWIHKGFIQMKPGLACTSVKETEKADLLSLGTRHRKAAMSTMCLDSLVAVTCSASGSIRLWCRGIPLAEIKPSRDALISSPFLPKESANEVAQ